jgi:arylamine N-acetyltransferase
MDEQSQIDILIPANHKDALSIFCDYFKVSTAKADLMYLQEILEHFANIPYENISKIINLNKSPDWHSPDIRLPEDVITGHILHGLGGTCFSLTYYLQSILVQSGFSCYPVMADMRAGENIHCCLVVEFGTDRYLVDPGYLLTKPIELNPHKPKIFRTETAGIELRYNPVGNTYDLFTFNRNEVKWRYRFRDRPTPLQEFMQHWLTSFGRNSMNGICLTRVLNDGILFVNRTFMRQTTFSGKKNFNIKNNYHYAISENFGIDKQLVEQAQAALAANLEKKRSLGLWTPKSEKSRQ